MLKLVKNWKTIAEIKNEQLRLLMISAKGELLEGLANGFPQYFLGEGEVADMPTWEKLKTLIKEAHRRDKILDIIRDLGVPHVRFSFEGQCIGSVDGVPYSKGGFYSVRYGPLTYYYKSHLQYGDVADYKGSQWIVVWNGFAMGNISIAPTHHTLIMVSMDALSLS